MYPDNSCLDQDCGGGKGRPLGFENTSPAFLIFLAGVVASWVVVAGEVVVARLGGRMVGQDRREVYAETISKLILSITVTKTEEFVLYKREGRQKDKHQAVSEK